MFSINAHITGWNHAAPADSALSAGDIADFRAELSLEADEHFSDSDIAEFIEGGCEVNEAEAEYLAATAYFEEIEVLEIAA